MIGRLNHVAIVVPDLEAAAATYADLLGATFTDASWTGEPFGIQVAISWNAGVELCAPAPGRAKDCVLTPFLEQRGEGIINVVFDVDDAEQSLEGAKAVGVE